MKQYKLKKIVNFKLKYHICESLTECGQKQSYTEVSVRGAVPPNLVYSPFLTKTDNLFSPKDTGFYSYFCLKMTSVESLLYSNLHNNITTRGGSRHF